MSGNGSARPSMGGVVATAMSETSRRSLFAGSSPAAAAEVEVR